MFDVRCSMFDVRCSMFDVRCSMFDVRCSTIIIKPYPFPFELTIDLSRQAGLSAQPTPGSRFASGFPGPRVSCNFSCREKTGASSLFRHLTKTMANSEPASWVSYQRAKFTTLLPADYRYSPGHYWLSRQADGLWRVGFTKFAVRMLGELVDHGFTVAEQAPVVSGQKVGWVEGFKAVADLYCLVNGQFVGGNPALQAQVTLLSQEPYTAGWLYQVRGEPDSSCLDVAGYQKILDNTIDKLLERTLPSAGPA
jgi:glycine cleavage system H protein